MSANVRGIQTATVKSAGGDDIDAIVSTKATAAGHLDDSDGFVQFLRFDSVGILQNAMDTSYDVCYVDRVSEAFDELLWQRVSNVVTVPASTLAWTAPETVLKKNLANKFRTSIF